MFPSAFAVLKSLRPRQSERGTATAKVAHQGTRDAAAITLTVLEDVLCETEWNVVQQTTCLADGSSTKLPYHGL
jgi:formate dehydrogenase maturation protein FdhE